MKRLMMKLKPSVEPSAYKEVAVMVIHVASPCNTRPPVGVPAGSLRCP